MIAFMCLLIINTLWIWGIRCVLSEGFVFEKVGDWLESTLPEIIYKPLVGCAACMSSIHGSLWYWTYGVVIFGPEEVPLKVIVWIVYVFSLCGLNFILLESIYKE